MKGKLSWAIFWALVGVLVVIICTMLIPAVRELLMGFLFIIISGAVFLSLGVALIFLTVKERVGGTLMKFLILTGASAAGFFVFVLLHNVFYGLGIEISHIVVLSQSMEVLHIVFFCLAVFVCPLGFLVGVVGSIVLAIKRSRVARKSLTSP